MIWRNRSRYLPYERLLSCDNTDEFAAIVAESLQELYMEYCWPKHGEIHLMGILNVTPDSFSDGGRLLDMHMLLQAAEQMAAAGADILDIGGESTRPGAAPVSLQQELDRVLPALEAVKGIGLPVSIDTSKPEVMRFAIAAGAAIINDVMALRMEGALAAVADSQVAICLMHMQGEPRGMQSAPQYHDVVSEVRGFLTERVHACQAAGIAAARLCVDPGFGFGKTLQHNLSLLRHLSVCAPNDLPLLAGLSRKSMIGAITHREISDRLTPSVVLALLAVQHGARVVRVHDVRETRDALRLWQAVQQAN